jgi:hypothetical protein
VTRRRVWYWTAAVAVWDVWMLWAVYDSNREAGFLAACIALIALAVFVIAVAWQVERARQSARRADEFSLRGAARRLDAEWEREVVAGVPTRATDQDTAPAGWEIAVPGHRDSKVR